jgi:transposase
MFIRKTRKIDAATKKSYFSYQLIESVRTERGPRQRIMLNLGQIPELDMEQLKELANRIEAIMSGQTMCVLPSQEIESLAQAYASQLIRRLSNAEPQPKSLQATEPKEFAAIDVLSIEQCEPRTVGAEHLLLQMIDQLQLSKQMGALGLSEKEIALGLGTIIARAVFPASERATHAWLVHNSGLGELIDFDFQKTSLNDLYRISDTLLRHKDVLEQHLEITEQNVHGYKNTITLYDLTNTYMEGQAKGNPKAAHGVSKEKRSDCPLISLGLAINEHGFVHRTKILSGNISEPKTLEAMIISLNRAGDLFKPTIVLDAGISSEENLQWLRKNGYTYVVSARQNAPSLDLESELVPVEDSKNNVKAALIKSSDAEEKWLYCESKAKAAVASQMKELFKQRFEIDFKKLVEGIKKPKGRKKYAKVLERIGRLKEKHKRISGCYEITVTASTDGQRATLVDWAEIPEKMEDKLTGHYFLRTNLIDKGPKELWTLYNTLRGVEDVFRFMKSSLGLRPVYHQKEGRVDGHLWITILAYHLIQNCLYQLGKQGVTHQWAAVLHQMSSRVRITMRAQLQDGKILYHRSTTKAEEHQGQIYKALGLSSQISKAKKTII